MGILIPVIAIDDKPSSRCLGAIKSSLEKGVHKPSMLPTSSANIQVATRMRPLKNQETVDVVSKLSDSVVVMTDSKRTCTMGNDGSNALGIIPTAVRALFDKTSLDTSNHVEFGVTLVEVYGEVMRHMLSPTLARLTRASDCCSGIKTTTLTFVDLAGSERQEKTLVEGLRFKESVDINTHRNLSETLNSLGYASRARRIVIKLTANQTNDLQVARLRAQIELLRATGTG
ncbi:hypothetical protein DYB28_003011 [Aphanomyces astaci]|uniref:Kinesin motor domain-containing protein n=1 Tax=Aphanomyces astaci TaxID=112090 RepID=A0A9X8E451_APHAT|nr:hypothetical protein DYB28_003011 [Aphanomyces astaci]